VAASALAVTKSADPTDVLEAAWPSDQRAALILRAAQSSTSTGDFPAFDKTGLFQSLAPSSAALQLFERGLQLDLAGITTIRIPNFASLPPAPIFIGEGKPAPNVHWTFDATVLGPARKVLILAAVTGELETATPESASALWAGFLRIAPTSPSTRSHSVLLRRVTTSPLGYCMGLPLSRRQPQARMRWLKTSVL
jgi:hypothetical protein